MREHRDDDHPNATAETGFADPSEPCPKAEDDDFVDGACLLLGEVSIAGCQQIVKPLLGLARNT